ncbi:hypothetical protein A9W95_18460 [Mycobacterium sp. 1423905.2]|nr:hypothetical protein A9W95_18460 [Mycobacterium sp. 1423905.2]
MRGVEEACEFACDAGFFTADQFKQNVLSRWEVEVEGAAGYTRSKDHGVDVGCGCSGPLELHDCGVKHPFPRLATLRFTADGCARHLLIVPHDLLSLLFVSRTLSLKCCNSVRHLPN